MPRNPESGRVRGRARGAIGCDVDQRDPDPDPEHIGPEGNQSGAHPVDHDAGQLVDVEALQLRRVPQRALACPDTRHDNPDTRAPAP